MRNEGKGGKVAILCVETYFRYLVHFRNLAHLPIHSKMFPNQLACKSPVYLRLDIRVSLP